MDIAFKLALAILLGVLCYQVVGPLLVTLVWSVILTISLMPAFVWLSTLLRGWQSLSALIITLIAFLLFAGPVGYLATQMIGNVRGLAAQLQSGGLTIPKPPEDIADWPIVGEFLATRWSLAATDLSQFLQDAQPKLQVIGGWLLTAVAEFGQGFLQFMIAIAITGLLLPRFDAMRTMFIAFAERINGPQGAGLVELGGATVRNVAVGIMGIALLQGLLSGLTFLAVGLPAAGLLAFLVMLFSALQIGPAIVIIPAIIYAFAAIDIIPAIIFTAVIIPIMLLDNIFKPIFVSRGLDTPMAVVFMGIVGGVLAYGVVGLFVGPVVLGIGYSLMREWIRGENVKGRTNPTPQTD